MVAATRSITLLLCRGAGIPACNGRFSARNGSEAKASVAGFKHAPPTDLLFSVQFRILRTEPQPVRQILVVLVAGVLHGLLARSHVSEYPAIGPGLGVKLGILHPQIVLQMIPIGPRPALNDVHGVAV